MVRNPEWPGRSQPTMTRRRFGQLVGGVMVGAMLARDAPQPGPWTDPKRYGEETVAFSPEVSPIRRTFDVQRGMDWSKAEAITETPSGLRVSRLNRTIINKRNPIDGRQSNPPINTCGGYLRTNGDFMVTCEMESTEPTHVQLYGDLPNVLDDERYENGRVDCAMDADELAVTVWRGHGHSPVKLSYKLNEPGFNRELRVQCIDDQLLFFDRGGLLGPMESQEVFSDGRVWFGLNNYTGDSLVRALTFEELGTTQQSGHWDPYSIQVPRGSDMVMQRLVDHYGMSLKMGSAVSPYPMMRDLRYMKHYLDGKYKILTIENLLKPQYFEWEQGMYSPKDALALIDTILRHDILLHGHVPVYDKGQAAFWDELPYDTPAQRAYIGTLLENTIMQFGETFGDKLYSCDVTNETWDGYGPAWLRKLPFMSIIPEAGGHLRPNIFLRALGKEWLRIAYRAADAVMPNTKLTFGEFGLELDPDYRAKDVFGLIDYVRAGGGRVDMVGSQTHISFPGSVVQQKNYQTLVGYARDAGVGLRFSEVDVTPLVGSMKQAEQFCLPLEIALENPDVVDAYSLWGSNDYDASQAYKNILNGEYTPGGATPIDRYWQYKYAWQAIQNTIHQVGSSR